MNTLVVEPVARKKVQNEYNSISEVLSSLEITFKKPNVATLDLSQAVDLFKNNADFINYGLSSMMDLS